SERGVTMLKGSRVGVLASLLDGTRNLAAVLEAMPDGMAPEQVAALIGRLAEAGLVTLHTPLAAPVDEGALAYRDASGIDATAAVASTAAASLRLITVGTTECAPVLSALHAANLSVEVAADLDPGQADLSVVLCDDYLDPRLAQVDAAHRAIGRPWLLAK